MDLNPSNASFKKKTATWRLGCLGYPAYHWRTCCSSEVFEWSWEKHRLKSADVPADSLPRGCELLHHLYIYSWLNCGWNNISYNTLGCIGICVLGVSDPPWKILVFVTHHHKCVERTHAQISSPTKCSEIYSPSSWWNLPSWKLILRNYTFPEFSISFWTHWPSCSQHQWRAAKMC